MEKTFAQMSREEICEFITGLCQWNTSKEDIIAGLQSIGYEGQTIIRRGSETSGWTISRTFFVVVLYRPSEMLFVDVTVSWTSHAHPSPT